MAIGVNKRKGDKEILQNPWAIDLRKALEKESVPCFCWYRIPIGKPGEIGGEITENGGIRADGSRLFCHHPGCQLVVCP
jgi:hypothetical protein